MKRSPMIACLFLLVALPGCSPGGAAPAERLPTNAQIDSGNVRFSAGDHTAALIHYRAATVEDDANAAAWFGIYMASEALGDTVVAAEAMLRVQQLVPDAAPGAHPHGADAAAPHPGTHPDAPTRPRP
jgi:hypothetical protein